VAIPIITADKVIGRNRRRELRTRARFGEAGGTPCVEDTRQAACLDTATLQNAVSSTTSAAE
jgi:hypothetical protein